MFITAGRYQYCRRTVAYRSDYCLACDDNTVSEQQRTFDVFHVYFFPVLPLGFRRHWYCVRCRQNPHARVKTSQGIKILGLCLFSLFAIISWIIPNDKPEDEEAMWGLRIGSTCLVALFVGLIWFHKPGSEQTLTERHDAIPRFAPSQCLACGEPLADNSPTCAECQVEYL